MPPRVALVPGSARARSLHRLLARSLVGVFARHGVDAEVVDLGEFPMPLYDGDAEREAGVPPAAAALHDRIATFDGLVFVSPEYNGGPSALLKNAIDWVTRVDRHVFAPLLLGLAAASPGSRGAVTGLGTLRRILEHMRLDVAPEHLSIPNATDAFLDVDGEVGFARPEDEARAEQYVAAFVAELRARPADRARAAG